MTVWPSRLPPVSEVTGFSPYRLDGDLLKLDPGAQITTHEISDELYLRELYEVDTRDTGQILGFVNTYGRLGHPTTPVTRSEDDKLVIGSDRPLIRLLGVDVPDFRELPWEDWWAEVNSHVGIDELGVIEKGLFYSDGLLHMDALRGWVRGFQRLTRLYLKYQRGESTESEMVNLGIVITDLMTAFTPVLDAVYDEDAEDWSPFRDTYLAPRLESVLALQMFNHIAEGDVYHVCEYDNRLFVHQRGRAEYGQHRKTGVKFCSTQCATSSASRDYRRRQSAKDTEET